MTSLLLKTKTGLFKWLRQQLCNGERDSERARERERERETRAQTQTGNSEKLQGSILLPCFNSKFTELIVNNTPVFFPSM